MRSTILLVCVLTLFASGAISADNASPAALAAQAVSRATNHEGQQRASQAQLQLRVLGQPGLDALLAAWHAAGSPDEAAWHSAIDIVAGQRLARFSGLFWYDDLDQAKAEALRSKRPILSLHLLGHLVDGYSCANSRFFRTVLYADPELAAILRQRFVLHAWSERQASTLQVLHKPMLSNNPLSPVTIMQRGTITGNSVHYVLDAQGVARDVLPGLVSPAAFHQWLDEALVRVQETKVETGLHHPFLAHSATHALISEISFPDAVDAAPNARAKGIVEARALHAFGRVTVSSATTQIAPSTSTIISAVSQRIMRHELQAVATAMRLNVTSASTAARIDQAMARFLSALEHDTQINRVILQPRCRELLNERDVRQLNRKIYSDILLSPLDDPWMGLDPLRTYDALPEGAVFIEQFGC